MAIYELTGKEASVIEKEKIPCGHSVTTKYFLDGVLVRQDVEIQVDRKTMGLLTGDTGEVG